LVVWLGSERVATLEQRKPYEIVCRYTDLALDRWPRNSPLLSCSLPLGPGRLDAVPFCRGLLPEGRALDFVARLAKVASNDVLGLLARFGCDVPGAFAFLPDGMDPTESQPQVVEYDASGLEQEVRGLRERPLALYEDSNLSLAGLQDKMLLVALPDAGWARPVHGYPSTHILKTDDPAHPGIVDAEAACLHLARAAGLTSISSELPDIGGTRCLIVSRFDRLASATGLPERLHQEDVCQATGTDPIGARGRAKYERAGGPGFRQIAGLLSEHARNLSEQLDMLVQVMTFNVLIGNADAHGKNLALLHEPLGTIQVAPLYDTVPTMLWPKLRAVNAMRVNGKDDLNRITVEDLVAEAASWGQTGDQDARRLIEELVLRVADAAEDPSIHDRVKELVLARAELLLNRAQR
jgi:serine/threonine-protein kinase HipA